MAAQTTEADESRSIGEVTQRVLAKFPAQSSASVSELVTRIHREYDGSPIRSFVPVLVEREVLDRLRDTST